MKATKSYKNSFNLLEKFSHHYNDRAIEMTKWSRIKFKQNFRAREYPSRLKREKSLKLIKSKKKNYWRCKISFKTKNRESWQHN